VVASLKGFLDLDSCCAGSWGLGGSFLLVLVSVVVWSWRHFLLACVLVSTKSVQFAKQCNLNTRYRYQRIGHMCNFF
jgi:hypothetical protein